MNTLISQRHSLNRYGQRTDSLENDYISYFESFGLALFPVSNASSCLERMIQVIRPVGIILSGGEDVSTALTCGDESGTQEPARQRDRTETLLLDYALKHRIRVLGICRGLQFVNVHFKGALEPDITRLDPAGCHRCPGNHTISLMNDELTANTKKHGALIVNSYHRQAVHEKGLAPELQSFAMEETARVVEGLYHPSHPLAAIQWHPERSTKVNPLDRILVEAFRDGALFWR